MFKFVEGVPSLSDVTTLTCPVGAPQRISAFILLLKGRGEDQHFQMTPAALSSGWLPVYYPVFHDISPCTFLQVSVASELQVDPTDRSSDPLLALLITSISCDLSCVMHAACLYLSLSFMLSVISTAPTLLLLLYVADHLQESVKDMLQNRT